MIPRHTSTAPRYGEAPCLGDDRLTDEAEAEAAEVGRLAGRARARAEVLIPLGRAVGVYVRPVALEAADAVGPALALGGVMIGLLVNGRRQDRQWRRDKRTDVYAKVLTAAGELGHQLSHISYQYADESQQPLDWDNVSKLTQPLRAAADLAHLYAGLSVAVRLYRLVDEAGKFTDVTPADLDLAPYSEALRALQLDMHTELTNPSWPLLLIGYRRAVRAGKP
jgi:hypothetical protein